MDGKRVNAEAKSLIRHGLPELIHRALVGWNEGPQPASGLVELDGHVAIAAICALTPESEEGVEAPAGERNLILFAKRLDASYLADALPMLRVADLKIAAPKAVRPDATASLPLLAADGHHLADLVWSPARPAPPRFQICSRSWDSRSRRCSLGLIGLSPTQSAPAMRCKRARPASVMSQTPARTDLGNRHRVSLHFPLRALRRGDGHAGSQGPRPPAAGCADRT